MQWQALKVVVLIVLISSSCVVVAIEKIKIKDYPGCRKFTPPGPHDKSILFSQAHGRLGNQLLLYGFLLQLKISLKVDVYIDEECMRYLERFFAPESIKLKALERTFCDYGKIPFEIYKRNLHPLLVDKAMRQGRVFNLFPKTGDGDFDAYKSEKHPGKEHDRLIEAYHHTLRRVLKFKPEVRKHVVELYDEIARKMQLPKKEITFIGVHNRRTDHIKFHKEQHNKKPLTPDFFIDAMDEMREDSDNPAFLFVSDDMDWGRKHLGEVDDLFFVGSGVGDDDFHVAADLAIMAAANKTIITRGTYSMFGSILSGGEYYTEYGLMVPNHVMYPDDPIEQLYL